MASGIYCIENLENHKKYIGWAFYIKRRIENHLINLRKNKHTNKYLQSAWNKYGEEKFNIWIIEEYPRDREILILMEIYFIAYHNSFYGDGKGYNLTRGGDGGLGTTRSNEWKEFMSKRMSGKNSPRYGISPSEETREKQRISHLGKKVSLATREKQSKSWTGKNNPLYGKFGKDNPNYGSKRSVETRKKMSDAQLGEKNYAYGTRHTDKWKKEQSDKMMGKNHPLYGKKMKSKSSVYYGVYKKVCRHKKIYVYWNVELQENNKKIQIGLFKSEIEAAKAYDRYVIENNLDRPLNFPENYPNRIIDR